LGKGRMGRNHENPCHNEAEKQNTRQHFFPRFHHVSSSRLGFFNIECPQEIEISSPLSPFDP